MHLRSHGGRPPQGTLDFSTPLNPLGPPPQLVEAIGRLARDAYRYYPDYEYKEFKEAIAGYYGLDPEKIVPLNGAAEAFYLALAALRPGTLISVEPTFGDHSLAIAQLGITWVTAPLTQGDSSYMLDPAAVCNLPYNIRRGSLLLVSNPNNPTGSSAPPNIILEVAECMEEGVILIDEAFMDLSPARNSSLLGRAPDNVVVVRSLTKSLAIPGLRAGFAYTENRRIVEALDALRQPWNVNTLAARVIIEALMNLSKDIKRHLDDSKELVLREASWLRARLDGLGLVVYETQAPFLLVHHPRARHPELQRELNKRGIHVRDASSFTYLTPYHSRISVRVRRENELLLRAFNRVLRDLA